MHILLLQSPPLHHLHLHHAYLRSTTYPDYIIHSTPTHLPPPPTPTTSSTPHLLTYHHLPHHLPPLQPSLHTYSPSPPSPTTSSTQNQLTYYHSLHLLTPHIHCTQTVIYSITPTPAYHCHPHVLQPLAILLGLALPTVQHSTVQYSTVLYVYPPHHLQYSPPSLYT